MLALENIVKLLGSCKGIFLVVYTVKFAYIDMLSGGIIVSIYQNVDSKKNTKRKTKIPTTKWKRV